jgi:hypothetical protein
VRESKRMTNAVSGEVDFSHSGSGNRAPSRSLNMAQILLPCVGSRNKSPSGWRPQDLHQNEIAPVSVEEQKEFLSLKDELIHDYEAIHGRGFIHQDELNKISQIPTNAITGE